MKTLRGAMVIATLGLSLTAFGYSYKLKNTSSNTAYGGCGTDTAYNVSAGSSQNFECSGNLSVYNSSAQNRVSKSALGHCSRTRITVSSGTGSGQTPSTSSGCD